MEPVATAVKSWSQMNILWQRPLVLNARGILEQAGYHYFVDPNTGKESFVMRLGRGFYPRYHVYVREFQNGHMECDVHIDQKQHSEAGYTAHMGEYDGDRVQEECDRIARWLEWASARG